MKREFFVMLYMIIFVAIIFTGGYFFGEKVVTDNINRYIVVWILLSVYVGQYSMRFPKRF